MSEKAKTVRVAVVQAAPVVFDLEKTLEKGLPKKELISLFFPKPSYQVIPEA